MEQTKIHRKIAFVCKCYEMHKEALEDRSLFTLDFFRTLHNCQINSSEMRICLFDMQSFLDFTFKNLLKI